MSTDPTPRESPAHAGRGRPKDPAKAAAILQAARRLFSRHGVEAATVEAIAAEAGVAKATVYGHFSDKLTLFEAMVHHESSRIAAALAPDVEGRSVPVREVLQAFGMRLITFLVDPEIVALERLVSAEASRHPELGKRLFEAGPASLHRALAGVLAAAAAKGDLSIDDPDASSEMLAGMLQGFLLTELRMSARVTPSPAEIKVRVERAVALFCRAHMPARP